jgi:Chloroplast envelope transporter
MRITSSAVAAFLLADSISRNSGGVNGFSVVRPSITTPSSAKTLATGGRCNDAAAATSTNAAGSAAHKLTTALSAPSPLRQRSVQRRATHLAPLRFAEVSGGIEELRELTDGPSVSAMVKQVRKSPSLWKLAGYATIPVSAALGFGLVPSRRLAAHAAGALVTGFAGAIGKSRLDAVTESAALPAIAQAIIDHGIDDPATTNGYINEIKELHGIVEDDDFESMCADVYSKYLLGMVKHSPVPKTSEPKELERLKTALGLNNLLVGEAHAAAAQEWYRQTCLFTPEEDLDDPDHPDRQSMDKMLFLTERALRQGNETDEAFKFEMTRVAKAMKLKLTTAMDRVSEVQDPFYRKALKSVRAKLGTNQVSATMLERARLTLGISKEMAFDMHVACFNEEVRAQLGLKEDGVDDDDDDDDDDSAESRDADLSKAKFGEDSEEIVSAATFVLGAGVSMYFTHRPYSLLYTCGLSDPVEPASRHSWSYRSRRRVRNCGRGYTPVSVHCPGCHEGGSEWDQHS